MVMIDLTKPIVLVLARNPWFSGELAKAAREAGVNVKKFLVFRNPPPWSRVREYYRGASRAQLDVWAKFGEIASETRGKPIAERIKIIRERMAGYSAPGKKYNYRTLPSGRKVPEKPPRTMYLTIKKILGGSSGEETRKESSGEGVRV